MLEQSGAVSDGLVPGLAYRLGGKGSQAVRQVRGYHEDQFRTTAWMVTSVEWRLQVWTTQALLGSVFPFVDHGLFRDDGRARQILSVGLGFRVYLRKVLFPAFSIYLAWAAENRELSGGVTAGMKM
ncbi:MAG TPA: hypothetical protein PLM00_01945 [Spirochaetota bacterium]|nr:hypothetical protein [Spirochaetota bacterium]HPN82121.1 hypothetical protein [Spirochaetota bacterium]